MKTFSPVWLMSACFALLLCALGAHAAPTAAQQQAIRSACPSDYRTYCASVPTGGSAALQCLQKNSAQLSPSCQQAVQAATGSAAAPAESPSSGPASGATTTTAPAAQTATHAPAGGPTIIVIQPGQAMSLMRQACGADYRSLCAGMRILGGAALRCLVAHGPSLSPSCKGELSRLGQRF